jgi:hypothetical protein
MQNNLQRFFDHFGDTLLLYATISLGIFLFMLFFQPFPNQFIDLNSVLVFHAGYGAITFLLLNSIHLLSRWARQDQQNMLYSVNGIVFLILCTVSFAFYLKYVGGSRISFYAVMKIMLICAIPPVIIGVHHMIRELKLDNDYLVKENYSLNSQPHNQLHNNETDILEFYAADNAGEVLKLAVSAIVMVRSADNYVEIYCIENQDYKKKLIRNTLRNVEQWLRPYSCFIRCHRTTIVNITHIEKTNLKSNASFILLKGFHERIPVSRQYLLKVKEALVKLQG